MTIMHRTSVHTGKFSFEGFGSSEEAARLALRETLTLHAVQMELPSSWVDESAGKARISDIATGVAMFDSDDGDGVFQVAGSPTGSSPAVRFQVDVRGPSGWGFLEAYGTSEAEARDVAIAGLRIMVDAGTATSIEEMMEDAYVYAIRDGGGYRGGAVGDVGEPMLDGHLVPSLPDGDTEWLPTVQCRIVLVRGEQVLSDVVAYGRPSRSNRKSMVDFMLKDLDTALRSTLEAIEDPALRDGAERMFYDRFREMIPDAFMRDAEGRGEIVLADGSVMSAEFAVAPTAATDLVTRKV